MTSSHRLPAGHGRSTRRVRRIKADLKAARRQPCMRCGQSIDYDTDDPSDPNAFNAGHIKPLSLFPELGEDPANFQQEHQRCNKAAGNRLDDPGIGMQSEVW